MHLEGTTYYLDERAQSALTLVTNNLSVVYSRRYLSIESKV